MKPDVPAQVPSVETFFVAVAAAAEDVLTVEAARELDAGAEEALVVEEPRELAAPLPEHEPKAELHPVEQWSVVEPHQPYWLQQLP